MKTILFILFFVLVAASPGVQAHTDDMVRVVNRLRAQGGACALAAPPLTSQAALNDAAARLATGASLDAALKSAGYRMSEVQVITLTGESLQAKVETLIASRFCAQIGIVKLIDMGVYEGGNQIWIVLAAPFAPRVDMTSRQMAQRMLALVNEARAKPRRCGNRFFGAARSIGWSGLLENSASLHAADMAAHNYFSHTGRDGSTSGQRATDAAYSYWRIGENIAAGQSSPEAALAAWIDSPAHCANLMNGGYTEMGVAFAVDPASAMGVYWVQMFGAPR